LIKAPTAIAAPRLWTIDALRGTAALAVVLCHAVAGRRPDTFLEAFAYTTLSFGRYGVWLFFVISGFCIHYRWALRARAGSTAPPEFAAFWRRRIRRLYPPYLVALALFVWLRFGTAWTSPDALRLIGLHVLMLQNFSQSTVTGINEVFWTLATEEQLYLLYFVLMRLRAAAGWPIVLGAGVLARVAWFVFAGVMHRLGYVDVLVTQAAAAQWPIWMLGALSVEAMVGLVDVPRVFRNTAVCVALLTAAACISYGLLYTIPPGLVYRAVWFSVDLCWGLGFFVAVNLAVARQRREQAPSRLAAALAAAGIFSYSLYLTHEVVTTYAWRVASTLGWSVVPAALAIAVAAIASLGFARVFFQVFERPFLSVTSRAIRPAIAV